MIIVAVQLTRIDRPPADFLGVRCAVVLVASAAKPSSTIPPITLAPDPVSWQGMTLSDGYENKLAWYWNYDL